MPGKPYSKAELSAMKKGAMAVKGGAAAKSAAKKAVAMKKKGK